jgi:hypothetical protein
MGQYPTADNLVFREYNVYPGLIQPDRAVAAHDSVQF